MRRTNVNLHSSIVMGILSNGGGLYNLQPPVSADAPEQIETTANTPKIVVETTIEDAIEGTYEIAFMCQHKSNNNGHNMYSHIAFLIDDEMITKSDNNTNQWQTFSNMYSNVVLERGDHTFALVYYCSGPSGTSCVKDANISISLKSL